MSFSDVITLGAVTLPGDMFWEDEKKWNPVSQSVEVTVTGDLLIDETLQNYGKPITLKAGYDATSWVTRSQVEQLEALSLNLGAKHTLTLPDARTFTVMFKREQNPVEAEPIQIKGKYSSDDDYNLTLRLMEVEP